MLGGFATNARIKNLIRAFVAINFRIVAGLKYEDIPDLFLMEGDQNFSEFDWAPDNALPYWSFPME